MTNTHNPPGTTVEPKTLIGVLASHDDSKPNERLVSLFTYLYNTIGSNWGGIFRNRANPEKAPEIVTQNEGVCRRSVNYIKSLTYLNAFKFFRTNVSWLAVMYPRLEA